MCSYSFPTPLFGLGHLTSTNQSVPILTTSGLFYGLEEATGSVYRVPPVCYVFLEKYRQLRDGVEGLEHEDGIRKNPTIYHKGRVFGAGADASEGAWEQQREPEEEALWIT